LAEEPVIDVFGGLLGVGCGEGFWWGGAVGVGVGRFEEVVGGREDVVGLGEG
jgi:hypothetical protein